MLYTLIFQNGPAAGTRIVLEIGQIYTVGRGPEAQIQLPADDNLSSRYHATFTPMLDGVDMQDLRSRNGTFVEGVRLDHGRLQVGERVRIGRTELLLQVEDEHDTLPDGPAQDPGPTRRARPAPAPAPDDIDLDIVVGDPWTGEGPPPEEIPCDVCGALGPRPRARFSGATRLCAACADAGRTREPRVLTGIGSYQIVRLVGRGSAGVVYEARHTPSDAHVALKALVPESPLDRNAVARFLREQRLAIKLSHPRIVRGFDVGEDAHRGLLYIASEWLGAGDAEAFGSPRLDLKVGLALGADLFEAIAYLHGKGLIHRDIKPANILLVPDGKGGVSGKLADLGIIKNARDTGSRLTMDSDIGGTPLYVSPEQLLDFKWVGRSADIYSGAASIYTLLTGAPVLPIDELGDGHTSVEVYSAVLEDPRVPIRDRRPEVPAELAEWIDSALARSPTRRQQMDAARLATWLRYLADAASK